MKIAHIINVTEITEANTASYLHIAQPLTLKSMVMAQKAAKKVVDVELFAVKHKDEDVSIPAEFNWASDFDKYAWEHISTLENITPRKPLPRIKDIISSLYNSSDATYFIYTNVDIGLYPNFYTNIKTMITEGYDAFCINRKTLPKEHDGVLLDESNIELIFSLEGTKHWGIDCFVFRRDTVPSLKLGNVFLGYPPVGLVLKTQIELNSKKFMWFKDERMTFHLGNDRPWKSCGQPYWKENRNQAVNLIPPPDK